MGHPWYKRLGRSPVWQHAAGSALAGYLRFVHATTRHSDGSTREPDQPIGSDLPAIFAFWHGEHFMTALAVEPAWDMHVMISRSADGTINAIAAEKLGLKTVRGAGDTKGKGNIKGGMRAFRSFSRLLEQGSSVAMTADVPKIARKVSPGLVRLARHSGRPIIPCAYVTHPHITFKSWDRASLNLPFSKACIGTGAAIYIDKDDEDETLWCARIKEQLDALMANSYRQIGGRSAFPLGDRAEMHSPTPERSAHG